MTPGRAGTNLLDGQLPGGRRQRHRRCGLGVFAQQAVQALVGQLRGAPLLPHGNQLVDRAEHPAHEDGACDHHARGHLPSITSNAPRPSTSDCRHRRRPLLVAVTTAGIAGAVLQVEKAHMQGEPALAQGAEHAHGLDALGALQLAAGQLRRLQLVMAGLGQGGVGQALVEQRKANQQHGADAGHHPSQTLKTKITARYSGNHGASKKANSAGPVTNWRSWVRSPRACPAAPSRWRKLRSKAAR